jgi:hypothetical protein
MWPIKSHSCYNIESKFYAKKGVDLRCILGIRKACINVISYNGDELTNILANKIFVERDIFIDNR